MSKTVKAYVVTKYGYIETTVPQSEWGSYGYAMPLPKENITNLKRYSNLLTRLEIEHRVCNFNKNVFGISLTRKSWDKLKKIYRDVSELGYLKKWNISGDEY